MDKNFIEFWRGFYAQTPKGQNAMEDMAAMICQSFAGFERMTSMIQQVCSFDQLIKRAPDYMEMWKRVQQDLRKSLTAYWFVIGMVPREDHLELVRKYEELKERTDGQKETINHLQMALTEEKVGHQEITGKVQNLIQQQAEQYQKLMETLKQDEITGKVQNLIQQQSEQYQKLMETFKQGRNTNVLEKGNAEKQEKKKKLVLRSIRTTQFMLML